LQLPILSTIWGVFPHIDFIRPILLAIWGSPALGNTVDPQIARFTKWGKLPHSTDFNLPILLVNMGGFVPQCSSPHINFIMLMLLLIFIRTPATKHKLLMNGGQRSRK